MNIKLKNIQRFTMSCGIGGAIAAAIGVGAIGGATFVLEFAVGPR